VELIFAWFVFAIVVGIAASARGRNGFGWFLLSLIISPLFGLILVLVLPNPQDERERYQRLYNSRKCPFCAEMVLREAIVCKHCGSALEPPPQPVFAPVKRLSKPQLVIVLAITAAVLVVLIYFELNRPGVATRQAEAPAATKTAPALGEAPPPWPTPPTVPQGASTPTPKPAPKRVQKDAPMSLSPPGAK
jgi:hypothetical protein